MQNEKMYICIACDLSNGKNLENYYYGKHALDFGKLGRAHNNVIYMTYLLTESVSELWRYNIRVASFRCPVDIEVYDESGELVGRVINNVVDSSFQMDVFITVDGDEKYVYMPFNEKYTFKVFGTDTGIMNYSVEDIDLETNMVDVQKEFVNVMITLGKQMYCDIGGIISVPNTKLYVIDSTGNKTAEILPDGTEVPVNNNSGTTSGGGGGGGTSSILTGSFSGASSFTKGSGENLVFIVQKDFSLFKEVKVDSVLLTKDKEYKAENSSTKITLYADYLDTLATGKHTLVVSFTDGTSSTATFAVAGEQASATSVTSTMPVNPFADVSGTDWFIDDVIYVYDKGIMTGTSTDPMLFSPSESLTRAMIVTILYRHSGSAEAVYENSFNDVADGEWYTDAIKWATANSIVNGYGGGIFGTNDPISRQDLATILMRYMNYLKINLAVPAQWIIFADEANISDYAMDALQTFNKLGIINGTGTNTSGQIIVNPKGNATRAETAAILHRFMEKIVQ